METGVILPFGIMMNINLNLGLKNILKVIKQKMI